LRFGRLEIDRQARIVRVDGEERSLTGYQFDLLCALAASAGRVMSREALLDRLRGDELEAFDRSIDVHISRIRAAIEDDPKRPRRVPLLFGERVICLRAIRTKNEVSDAEILPAGLILILRDPAAFWCARLRFLDPDAGRPARSP
jgi:hypothetical protein